MGTDLQTPNEIVKQGGTLQQRQTGYQTAITVQRPRDTNAVAKTLYREAELAGELFFYGWNVETKEGKMARVEGPSVQLAMAAARIWGNCGVIPEPVRETPDAFFFSYTFVDLETGFNYSRPFRMDRHWTIYGKADQFRKEDMRFQIGASKAARNCIVNALPRWLIDKAIDSAKSAVRKNIEAKIKELEESGEGDGRLILIERALAVLKSHGVEENAVLQKFGVAKAKGLTIENLVTIRSDIYAITEGNDDAETLYPASRKEPQAASKSDAAAEAMKRRRASRDPEPESEEPDEGEQGESQPEPESESEEPDEQAFEKQLRERIKGAKDLKQLERWERHYKSGSYSERIQRLAMELIEMRDVELREIQEAKEEGQLFQ